MELCARLYTTPGSNGHSKSSGTNEIVFFRVPLESADLAEFRSHDPLENGGNGARPESSFNHAAWRAFYSYRDEAAGFEWQLWVRDLNKKRGMGPVEKILEPVIDSVGENATEKPNWLHRAFY